MAIAERPPLWYEITVTDQNGGTVDQSAVETLGEVRTEVTRFRRLYPTAQWITVNRHRNGRVCALIAHTVWKGTTAAERRRAAVEEAWRVGPPSVKGNA